MSEPMTKAKLVTDLRDSGDELVRRVSAVDAATLEQGRYEGGWNGRQILAHVASVEWTYPRLLDIARQAGAPASDASKPQPAAPAAMASGSPQILTYNDRQVAKREGVPVSELIAEFQKNRTATIAASEAADEALFSVEITSAGGAKGPLADVMHFVAVQHVQAHVRDLVGGA